MAPFSLAGEPLTAELDLTTSSQSSELTEFEDRLGVVKALVDALARASDVHKVIEFSTDRAQAMTALQSEPFSYTRDQAEAVLDMPFHWQSADVVQRLRAERDELEVRCAELREHVTEVVTLHWFG